MTVKRWLLSCLIGRYEPDIGNTGGLGVEPRDSELGGCSHPTSNKSKEVLIDSEHGVKMARLNECK